MHFLRIQCSGVLQAPPYGHIYLYMCTGKCVHTEDPKCPWLKEPVTKDTQSQKKYTRHVTYSNDIVDFSPPEKSSRADKSRV